MKIGDAQNEMFIELRRKPIIVYTILFLLKENAK